MSARMNRRGFTIIELMTVVALIAILASLALLKYQDLRRAAVASKVASELNAVKLAGYNYWADHQAWPADGVAGVVPGALLPHLPTGFQFANAGWRYTLEWDNFGQVGGSGGSGAYLIGVSVATTDPKLMRKLEQYLGTSSPMFSFGGKLTYVIQAPGGGY